ncbi:MAG: methyl-accepting chemotaxis protein [Frankiales bacterium]|nr:methyl-accepting chemotaxis protein [Frankiales bacterium]
MLWTIRRKLTAVTLLAVVFLLGVGATAIVGAQNASTASARQRDLSAALTYQLNGQTAQYGVRGDVFESMAVVHVDEVKAIIKEYENFAAEWQSAEASISTSKLPQNLVASAKDLRAQSSSVAALGRKAVTEALYSNDRARVAAATFDKAFDVVDAKSATFLTRLQAAESSTKAAADRAANVEMWVLVSVLCTAVVVLFLLTRFIARSIVRPLDTCVAGLEQVAKRDLTATFGRSSGDEVGRMVRALTSAIGDIRSALGEIAERSQVVDSASHELSAVSQQLAASAEETASQARSVSSAARTVNDNVTSVATGTAQLSGSMREVADSASDAATTAREAAALADRAELVLATLRDSSLQIGNTVTVIRGVAEQTHLLALNATIEAARAGASGRGFAVVAEEVKSLARTTSESTDQVVDVVEAMQDSVREVVDVIARIASTVRGIDGNQSTIAHAVEEQTLTAGTMRNGVADAAEGIRAITANIDSVAESAAATTEGVNSAQRAADELAQTAAQLAALAGGFRY